VIKSVEITAKGPDIIISRSDNHFLFKLFEMEVPEIEDGIIEITKIARNPGERAKIIVHSHDRRIDAVGACVGMRGSRIQAIVRELNNEKIDIVNFSEKPEVLITRALSPAKPIELHIDDDRKYCVAIFDKEELETAIGKGGVNINLASQLTEFRIDAYNPAEYETFLKNQETTLKSIPKFPKSALNGLSDIYINNVATLLAANENKLLTVDGITEDSLEEIYNLVQSFLEIDKEPDNSEDAENGLTEDTQE
jgi:N utilization substance protein A